MLKFKKIKKTVSLIMALAFCLCALPTVIAADESTIDPSGEPSYALSGTTMDTLVTIIEGTTTSLGDASTGQFNIQLRDTADTTGAIFTAYKLLNIDRDTTTGMLKVSIPAEMQEFWNTYTGGTATVGTINTKIYNEGATTASKNIIDKFISWKKTTSSDLTSLTSPSGPVTDHATKIETDFGFYAVLQTGAPYKGYVASAPVLACLPMQNTDDTWLKSYTIEPKDDTISITKQVKSSYAGDTYKDETITNIGDTVSYEIIAELPKYGADIVNSGITYTIADTPNPTNALTLDTNSIKVSYTKDTDKTTTAYDVINNANYTITPSDNGFTFNFKDGYYANDINGKGYTYIKITYSATLNGSAVVEGDGNVNTATLEYSSYVGKTATTTADAKVYTMGLDITKVDKEGGATLAGATFEVYTDAAGTEANRLSFIDITGDGGIKRYRVAAPGETGTTTTIEVTGDGANKGKLMIDGLNDTTYYLKETKAPTGYNLPKEMFAINVQPTAYTNGTDTDDYDTDNHDVLDFDEHRLSKNISNTTGIDLPVTGGMGTVIFTAIGLLLMAGAAYFLFRGKKSSN